ncbi:hypothetical protein BCR37DRAFT_382302 [Protomyces lactucae-debilis]|uniref:Inhibitor I9 domain-containing protein n=1 Tax=Protomyces lactucae-debilis TaxID=2754530 RepID=A0A1Y2F472_PROLT|nr:uncharacterized protein BCR37DRAFT_382302 [Protomyces lactucae-debilis]ORY78653.1 hypothetical protein BCR37DRAFT_382302 [Protomyces lactucae-debilis]
MRFSIVSLLSACWIAYASIALAAPTKNQVARPKSQWPSYVVTFEDKIATTTVDEIRTLLRSVGAEITHEYKLLFNGFSVVAPEETMEEIKQKHAYVSVERDQVISVSPKVGSGTA